MHYFWHGMFYSSLVCCCKYGLVCWLNNGNASYPPVSTPSTPFRKTRKWVIKESFILSYSTGTEKTCCRDTNCTRTWIKASLMSLVCPIRAPDRLWSFTCPRLFNRNFKLCLEMTPRHDQVSRDCVFLRGFAGWETDHVL